jgi:peptidoglycan/xylan/chitin deacetylase (PgdA/CDA1 family)
MNRVIILMYHIIDNPLASQEEKYCCTPANFEKQMRFLRDSNYVPVGLNQFVNELDGKGLCPDNSVVVTFDDGFDNMLVTALPVLQKYDIPATVFILSDRIDHTNDWMHTRGFPSRKLLSKSQLLELKDAGICIGSHTRTHPRLTDISKDQVKDEISTSKKILEDTLGSEVAYFAYPFGLYNENAHAAVVRAGYVAACSTRSGFNRQDIDRFALRRIEIYGNDSIQNFKRKLKFGANDIGPLYSLQYYSSRLAVKLGLRQH